MGRILVVEDDISLASLVKEMLETRDHSVWCAHDGRDALEQARRHKPELVLLDIMLPFMSGIDVCRTLKSDERTADVKIVMITALGRMSDVESSFAAGAMDYVMKPFSLAALLKKVEDALAR